ncbi:hypothetical protein ATCV1_z218L [Acanthocystis turfacea chlorella virus 1]|uniref:Uncharacterized protein z218L n=1 Tax=Chlorovirus heliozoae TaxID=322019 RepID=A7K8H8_9PHYC|nr:hypothetical protein ATCV1_z218L [Acanthocystis turfacea chlorella virus 1]ABT16352.1 hypothetical protein ATCV1_z218L [Acanthocystis turfacea chlorella virus 1]
MLYLFGRYLRSRVNESWSTIVTWLLSVTFTMFAMHSSLGPPNSDQLSMTVTVASLPHRAEHVELPFHAPISRYLASSVSRRLL